MIDDEGDPRYSVENYPTYPARRHGPNFVHAQFVDVSKEMARARPNHPPPVNRPAADTSMMGRVSFLLLRCTLRMTNKTRVIEGRVDDKPGNVARWNDRLVIEGRVDGKLGIEGRVNGSSGGRVGVARVMIVVVSISAQSSKSYLIDNQYYSSRRAFDCVHPLSPRSGARAHPACTSQHADHST